MMRNRNIPWLTLLLAALVGISLYLTSRILYTETVVQQQSTPAGSTSQNATVSTAKEIEEVFAPVQMTIHKDGSHFMTQDPDIVSQANELMGEWQFTDFVSKEIYSPEAYQELLLEGSTVELRFFDVLPLELISRYFEDLPEEEYDTEIDRIIISSDANDPVYLLNDATYQVIQVTRSEASMNSLLALYNDHQEEFAESTAHMFAAGADYLPVQEVPLSKQVYLVERQSNSYYINQLFEDTSELSDNSDATYVRYSDNVSELSVQRETGLLTFFRNSLETVSASKYRLIRDSFHEIKFLDNWANAFQFSTFNETTGDIYYRRSVNGLPIFGPQNQGLTRIRMGNTAPIELQFSTQLIQTPLTDREEEMTLPSGEEMLAEWKEAGYAEEEIEAVTIGYDWIVDDESDRIVNLVPKWYIRMDDTWHALEEWVAMTKAGDERGL